MGVGDVSTTKRNGYGEQGGIEQINIHTHIDILQKKIGSLESG